MADPLAQKLLERFASLKTFRSNFDTMWQLIADDMIGRRDFLTFRTPGERRAERIIDTTALQAGGLLSSALHSLLTNASLRWFTLQMQRPELMESFAVRSWLQQVEQIVLNEFNRPEANFASQIHEVYHDLVFFGTACCLVLDQPGEGVLFKAVPLGQAFIAESDTGKIDTVYRVFKWTNRQAVQKWGRRAEAATKALEKGGSGAEERHDYLHAVFPNDKIEPGKQDRSGMAFRSTYLELEGKKILEQGGFHEMPYQTPRWEKDAGEVYGRGPGTKALPEAKMLNAIAVTTIKAAQKAVDPPLLVPDGGVIQKLQTSPGGLSVYRADAFNENPIREFANSGNVPLGLEFLDNRQTQVKAAFHEPVLAAFQDPRMTATQVIELAQQTQRLLSPVLGRIQVELLEPMIERVYGILDRAGKLPPPPAEIRGQPINIDYVSPVARAQKAGETQALIDMANFTMQIGQANPGVLDVIDWDQIVRAFGANKSVPNAVLHNPVVVAAKRQAQAELAAQQAQQQQIGAAADAAGAVLPGIAQVQNANQVQANP